MRVLILSFYYPPDLSAGSFRTKALVDALCKVAGQDLLIDVITTVPNRYSSLETVTEAFGDEPGVKVTRIALPPHKSGMVDQSRAFLSYARAAMSATRDGHWDIVFATSSRLMTAALGAWISRKVRAPLYLDIRDLFTDTISDLLKGNAVRLVLPFMRWLERRTFRSAKRLNVVSVGFLDHVRSVAPNADLKVFTNGIDEEFLTADFTKAPTPSEELPLVLYAGNIGDGQGLHNILPEAAMLLDGRARFRVIGDGGRRRQLEAGLAAGGVRNVELLGAMPRAHLQEHYRAADVLFLHLNDIDAFRKVLPSKIFEYAATGKPILAGVAGSAAEFLLREAAGSAVFHPCDVEGMVDAFGQMDLSGPINRQAFRAKFARSVIMEEMARDILALGNKN
ncbi:glycosyltransferase family 4 protein [Devosia sp. CAU 1758]